MAKSKITVEQIDERIARWQSKLKRAVNTIDRLQRMRKQAVRKAAQPKSDVELFKEAVAQAPAKPVEKPAAPSTQPLPADDLAIPGFLKRGKDDPVAEQLKAEIEATKRAKSRGRIEKMKAKQRGELKKMPLTGKAALEAIRNG